MILMAQERGSIGLRLAEALNRISPVQVNAAEFARRLGVSPQRLNNWLKGKHDPPPEAVVKASEILGVTVNYLMGEENTPVRNPKGLEPVRVYRTGLKWIPVGGPIAAGLPSNEVADLEWIEIKDWGSNFERWGRRIDGYSMEPHLQPGDIAVFENRKWEPGHVVHAFKDGEDTVKAIRGHGQHAKLVATNPDYPEIDAYEWMIKGVLVIRIRNEPDGAVSETTYPYGMRIRF